MLLNLDSNNSNRIPLTTLTPPFLPAPLNMFESYFCLPLEMKCTYLHHHRVLSEDVTMKVDDPEG